MYFGSVHENATFESQDDSKDASNQDVNKWATYDCAFLEPEAFPPDFPPVILMVFGLVVKVGGLRIEFGCGVTGDEVVNM